MSFGYSRSGKPQSTVCMSPKIAVGPSSPMLVDPAAYAAKV